MAVHAQSTRGTQAPLAIIYNTSMDRPDAALALAALQILSNRNEARIGAVCVTGSGLNAAIFCDIVGRFYVPAVRSSNTSLPVGLAVTTPLAPDPPMTATAIDRKKENGDPQYVRGVRKVTDTSLAEAMLRNSSTLSVESAVVLSAPATSLARSLDLAGTKDLFAGRVKRLVIVDGGVPQRDPAALNKVIAEWPTPVVFCGRDAGAAIRFPGSTLDTAFAWAAAHPVADAYRAFKTMPYDAPLHDLVALYYAVHPDSELFTVTESGTLSVTQDGRLTFAPGAGNVHNLAMNPSTRAEATQTLVAVATSKPAPPPARGRGTQ
jgi:inosine-uridine nucleoside N-ribohydrolase